MAEAPEDGLYAGSHQFTFSEKNWRESGREFLRFLYGELSAFGATALGLWGLAGVLAAATNERVLIERLATPVLLGALAVAMYRAYRARVTHVPEALASENSTVHRIFRRQRCGWNAALARAMLVDRIDGTEATLQRIKLGAEYVTPRRVERQEYVDWLRTRPESMQRLVRAAMVLVTEILPGVIGRTTEEADLADLKDESDALARVYGSARDLEIECFRLVPPEEFAAIHEMTHGWTDTIRKSVREFCEILENLEAVDRKRLLKGDVPSPNFSITVGAPENMEEFNRRLEAVAG